MAEVTEDVALHGEADKLEPWTLKVFSRNLRNRITAAAKQEGLTTPAWMERSARSTLDGSNTDPGMSMSAADLVLIMQEARATADAAGVPVPSSIAREALALTRQALRAARGLPPPARRAPRALIGEG